MQITYKLRVPDLLGVRRGAAFEAERYRRFA